VTGSKSRAALVVAICLPLVAGCTSDDGGLGTSSPTASASDPSAETSAASCAILTAEDLTHATGLELSAQPTETTTNTGDEVTCVWSSESPEATVEVWISSRPADYGERRSAIQEAHGDAVDIQVPEADAAFTADSGRIVGLTGSDSYAEITFTYETDELADRTRQIAGLAAANL
jgi:hypothetical protein